MRRRTGLWAGVTGLVVVSAITAGVVVPLGPVAADQVSDLKAQATQITKDLVLEQLQIETFQQQYDRDAAKVQQDAAAIAATQNQIQADSSRVSQDRKRLQTEAIAAYINLDPQINGIHAMFEDPKQAPTKAEFEKVASGDIALTIDALRTDQNGLRAERVLLAQQEVRDQAITEQEAAATRSAHQTAAELESKQAEITGQLAVAVAQQQAAQAAAAAAAVRKAQAAASSHQAAPAQGGASTPSGDPKLPPFLQCVLQAESGGNYAAVSPDGTYMGGFQFSQSTWNQAAQLAGMPQLMNVPPNQASPAQQDDLAIALYNADGEQPWNDSCRNS